MIYANHITQTKYLARTYGILYTTEQNRIFTSFSFVAIFIVLPHRLVGLKIFFSVKNARGKISLFWIKYTSIFALIVQIEEILRKTNHNIVHSKEDAFLLKRKTCKQRWTMDMQCFAIVRKSQSCEFFASFR